MLHSYRNQCVFYVTATCNLNCRYCYIDKSPVLAKIDQILEESFKGDYYFNFMKEMFDDPQKLNEIAFWGGEPTYGLKRAFPTLLKAIPYFQNLTNFMFSTNLTTPTCVDDITGLINFLGDNFPYRTFHLSIQLSLDGPPEINDYNRGVGVTEKFTKNFSKLIFAFNTCLRKNSNVTVEMFFKGTLDNDSIKKLQDKESIIKYYQFYESFMQISNEYLASVHNFEHRLSWPNTATPSPHTTEDGLRFANLCRLINEIQEEGCEKYFKYYRQIQLFAPFPFVQKKYCEIPCLDKGCSVCGTGTAMVGLLPNHMISACHNGFTDLLGEYKTTMYNKYINNEYGDKELDTSFFKREGSGDQMMFSVEDYEKYEKQIQLFNDKELFSITNLASMIVTLAKARQIEKKYEDFAEAIKGAKFLFSHFCHCIRDNISIAGTKYLTQVGYCRLFLNGAREEIEKAHGF